MSCWTLNVATTLDPHDTHASKIARFVIQDLLQSIGASPILWLPKPLVGGSNPSGRANSPLPLSCPTCARACAKSCLETGVHE